MRLLLDTHVWLWGFLEPERLSVKLSEALEEPQNELWLSPISLWLGWAALFSGLILKNGCVGLVQGSD